MDNAAYVIRWWHPGQWLRIIWGVWVNQQWYRQTVQPVVEHNRSAWWLTCVQAVLGTTFVTFIGSTIPIAVVLSRGEALRWAHWAINVVASVMVIAIVMLMWTMVDWVIRKTGGQCPKISIGLMTAALVTASLSVSVTTILGLHNSDLREPAWIVVEGCLTGVALGIGFGVDNGGFWGKSGMFGFKGGIFTLLLSYFAFLPLYTAGEIHDEGLIHAVVTGTLTFLTASLAEGWATRHPS